MSETLPVELTQAQEALIANAIKTKKPYILAIESIAQELQYGTIDVKMEVRAGAIEKMSFFNTKIWLKEKSAT